MLAAMIRGFTHNHDRSLHLESMVRTVLRTQYGGSRLEFCCFQLDNLPVFRHLVKSEVHFQKLDMHKSLGAFSEIFCIRTIDMATRVPDSGCLANTIFDPVVE